MASSRPRRDVSARAASRNLRHATVTNSELIELIGRDRISGRTVRRIDL